MRTALLDIAAESPLSPKATLLPYCPSPGLLRCGRAAVRDGDAVSYHRLNAAALATLSLADLPAPLHTADRVLVSASGVAASSLATLRALLPGPVTWIDAHTAHADEQPDYALTRGHASCQAEVDSAPWWAPVHPWTTAGGTAAVRPVRSATAAAESFASAAASLVGVTNPTVYVNDVDQIVDMDRLRMLARGVHQTIDAHKTLVGLHMRIWPRDLLADPRLADHLTLLPLESLELLAGSFVPASAAHDPRVGGIESVQAALGRLATAGLAHLTTVSLTVALPGEQAEDCVDSLNVAVSSCTSARIRRLRVAAYLGPGGAPESAVDQHARFAATHQGWHPMEYRALFDMSVLLASAVPELTLIGPGWLPAWEPPLES